MEDATPILERQIDDQDDTDTQGTTEHPIQENKPKRKPNITKSQGRKGLEDSLSGNTCTRAARYDRENGRQDRAKISTTPARILGWVSGPRLSHTTWTVRSEPADSAASLGFGCL
nr:dickkopf-related protein 4 isoform X2 [Kogia breviceps]